MILRALYKTSSSLTNIIEKIWSLCRTQQGLSADSLYFGVRQKNIQNLHCMPLCATFCIQLKQRSQIRLLSFLVSLWNVVVSLKVRIQISRFFFFCRKTLSNLQKLLGFLAFRKLKLLVSGVLMTWKLRLLWHEDIEICFKYEENFCQTCRTCLLREKELT